MSDTVGAGQLSQQYNVATTIAEGSISIPDQPIGMTDIQWTAEFLSAGWSLWRRH